jgi:predicted transposase YdaD
LGIIGLVVASENEAVQTARNLINQVQQVDATNRQRLLELVERMLIYKFSNQSRQELEAMFGLTQWQQTRFYQEVKEEVQQETELATKLKTVPKLVEEGLSVKQIARVLELNIEVVQQAIEKQSRRES